MTQGPTHHVCPRCGTVVPRDAIVCPHCSHDSERAAKSRWLWAGAIVLAFGGCCGTLGTCLGTAPGTQPTMSMATMMVVAASLFFFFYAVVKGK